MFRRSAFRRLLRGSVFALLLLGMAIQPVLGFVGELHAIEHAVVAGHPDHHDDPSDGDEPGHALGTHGLLHQYSTSASCMAPAQLTLAAVALPAVALPPSDATPPAAPFLTLPFRPPIA